MIKIVASLSCEKRLEYLTRRLKESESAVLIAPEQFLFETERSMYRLLGAKKIAQTEITGFSKLAANIIKKHGTPKLYADDIVKSAVMYKTLSNLQPALTYYGKREGVSYEFTRRMLAVAADFKSAAITPDALRRSALLGSKASGDNESLSRKLTDITEIYTAYCELLDKEFADRLDDNRIAAELVNIHDCFRGKEVFVYEFDSFSASQLGLIHAAAESADGFEILLRTEFQVQNGKVGPFSASEGFRAVNSLINSIQNDTPCGFADLGGESFSPSVELWTADNVFDECEFVAAKIRELITETKITCNEIAVLVCDPGVTPRLKEAMSEYGIHCYADLPEPIITKPMTRFIISALEAVNSKLNTPELLSYIRSGFVRVRFDVSGVKANAKGLKSGRLWQKGSRYDWNGFGDFGNPGGKLLSRRLSKRGMDLLERAAERFALTYREWGEPFPDTNRHLVGIEPLREEIVRPLKDLRESCRDTAGDVITEKLCEFLLETMQLQRTVLGLCRGQKNLTDEFRQLWDLIIDVFESLHAALKDYPISIAGYTELLRGVFSSVNIAKPPQVLDAVVIADLERSRLQGIRAAFVMGANSGYFPKSGGAAVSGDFSAREIETMADNGLEISAKAEERYNYERLMVNKAMTLPSEMLFISAPLTDAAWEESRLAPIFDERKDKVGNISDLPLTFRVRTEKAARRIFAEGKSPVLAELLDRENDSGNGESRLILTPETALKLFSFEKFSPTAIETMMNCRFMFFCKYGLGISVPVRENEEEPVAMERGNIIHYCLDTVLRAYKDDLGRFYRLSDFELDGLVESCIKAYRGIKLPYDYARTNRQEYILMSFKPGIVRMLKHIRGDFESGGGFIPADFEKRVEFMFGAGHEQIRLYGKIDRVDRLSESGRDYVRIIDYKSGANKEMDFSSVFYGLDMQTLLYLFAECGGAGSVPDSVLPASALYMPSDGSRTEGFIIPENGVLTVEPEVERKRWLSSHVSSGIAVYDSELEQRELRYRSESGASRKRFLKVEKLTPDSYERLKEHCGKLIAAKVRQIKRGDVSAVPLAKSSDDSACSYCEFSSACGISKTRNMKIMNKKAIARVVGHE